MGPRREGTKSSVGKKATDPELPNPATDPQSYPLSRERPEVAFLALGSPFLLWGRQMGGQVRISIVGILRLHPPTPSNFLMPGTPRPPGH